VGGPVIHGLKSWIELEPREKNPKSSLGLPWRATLGVNNYAGEKSVGGGKKRTEPTLTLTSLTRFTGKTGRKTKEGGPNGGLQRVKWGKKPNTGPPFNPRLVQTADYREK